MEERENLANAQSEIEERIAKYKGKKISELKELLGITTDNKASFVKLARRMLGVSNNQFELCDGQLTSILKTVRVTGTSMPAEAMSFMPIDFDEWLRASSWHSSLLYQYFRDNVFVFFIFQQYPSGKRVADSEMTFLSAKVWKMSDYDLEHAIREVWNEVRDIVGNGKLKITTVEEKNGRTINRNNLPTTKFNGFAHLRPGGKNGEDKITLPDGQRIVRQRFWFNTSYVKEIIGM